MNWKQFYWLYLVLIHKNNQQIDNVDPNSITDLIYFYMQFLLCTTENSINSSVKLSIIVVCCTLLMVITINSLATWVKLQVHCGLDKCHFWRNSYLQTHIFLICFQRLFLLFHERYIISIFLHRKITMYHKFKISFRTYIFSKSIHIFRWAMRICLKVMSIYLPF